MQHDGRSAIVVFQSLLCTNTRLQMQLLSHPTEHFNEKPLFVTCHLSLVNCQLTKVLKCG